MSKAQKGNKENKKPKADKTQTKANVSAYKAAQGQGKPASSPFAKKTNTRLGLKQTAYNNPKGPDLPVR